MVKKSTSKDAFELVTPFSNISGSVEKGGVVFRQKKHTFTTSDGSTYTFSGKKEVYRIQNPRNFRRNPPTGAELQHQTLFGRACSQATSELSNPERYAYWEQRFVAQLRKPEADLPKSYINFRAFVRAAIYYSLRDQPSHS